MFNDTALIRMVIELLAKKYNWTYQETFDKFYTSKVCEGLSNKDTGIFTFSPKEVVQLFEESEMRK